MMDILEILRGGGLPQVQGGPGMQLASSNIARPYVNDVGPMEDFQDPNIGDPRTLSGRIQQAIGAKPPNEQGMVGEILSQRFQPTTQDSVNAITQTWADPTKAMTNQDAADQRMNLAQKMQSRRSVPANVQEYQYFSSLPLDQQAKYLQVKRAQQILNLGGTQGILNQTGPGLSQEFPVTPKPEDMPDFKEAQANASKTGELNAEKQFNQPKAQIALQGHKAATKNVLSKIDEALPQVSYATTGVASLSTAMPGTPASNLSANLATIQSNLAFQRLEEMRQNSPTGSALARVTQMEIMMLGNTINNIAQSQDPGQLRAHLLELKDQLRGQDARLDAAYKLTYPNGEGNNTNQNNNDPLGIR